MNSALTWPEAFVIVVGIVAALAFYGVALTGRWPWDRKP